MKKRSLLVVLVVIGVAAVALVLMLRSENSTGSKKRAMVASEQPRAGSASRVPAHYETPPDPDSLAPTLSPEKFTGLTRDAYRAVREIPQTIAQMPCYCHCDQSFGHKSLHSCFEDEHAAHCAVCAGEALMAYRLQKEEGLSAPQIRARLIAEYEQQ